MPEPLNEVTFVGHLGTTTGIRAAERRKHGIPILIEPRLRESLNRNIARITGGRYDQVEVDDQLRIRVVTPETGQLIPVDELSRGAQDQIFCLERLEIANLLDPATGTTPLFLDEPFVHFDETRLHGALELVAKEAASRQIVLFTTDQSVLQAADSLDDSVQLTMLDGP